MAAEISKRDVRKAVRLTLVSMGCLGVLFAALYMSLPETGRYLSSHPTITAYCDVALRYAYLLWLLAYFFVTTLMTEKSDQHRPQDVWFDVLQFVVTIVAASKLGFLTSEEKIANQGLRGAMLAANVAIAAICAGSLYVFRKDTIVPTDDSLGVSDYRWMGLTLSAIAVGIWLPRSMDPMVGLVPTAVLFVALATLMGGYGRMRIWVTPATSQTAT